MMPNKNNNAQEHLNKAASHNPEADETYNFSQVNEEVLDEASGVGIINVPPVLLQRVQKFVGSVILTMGVMKQHDLQRQNKTEQATALLNWCKRFQRKYGAVVLSAADLKKYVNSVTTLQLNADEIYNSLPDNLKKNPKTKELIDNMRISMKISNQFIDKGGSSGVNGTTNELDLGVPNYNSDIKGDNSLENIINLFNYSMGTVQHELQHTVQQIVLRNLNPNDQQTKRADGYSGDHVNDDKYYAGGIEFGPQVRDLSLRATEWLEQNKDELIGQKNKDISDAIKYAMATMSQSKVITVLRKYKQDARANKAMKLIYRDVSKFYDSELHMNDENDFDSTEKDISDGHQTHKSLEYPEAGESLMGDLFLKVWREFGEKPKLGSMSDMSDPDQFTLFVAGGYDDSYSVVFRHDHNDDYFILIKNSDDKKERINLTKEQMANLPIEYLGNMRAIKLLKQKIEDESTPDANLEGILFAIQNINESSGFFNNNSSKKVSFDDYIEEEGFFTISLDGVNAKIVCQTSGKKYFVEIDGGENSFSGTEKEVEELFTKIFDGYYKENVEPRHINKALLYSESIPDFDETLDYYVQRTAKRREPGEAAMAESSMRGLSDIVQNAELSHDIDDAEDQELINKGVLEEMPLQYDSFMGMDPSVYIDKKARKHTPRNMIPVLEHDTWTTYRGKEGYMAYDNDTGEAIATVEGHVENGWFNVEVTASSRHVKGIVYQIFMDIINEEGIPVLSGRLQSDDAIKFWKRLIQTHNVFVVANGEVLQKATPEKFHKYWSEQEDSPQSQFQFLLVQ